jgi:phosphoketolase
MKKPADPRILTINGGSSSIKFALFEAGDSLRRILEGVIERIGLPEAELCVKGLSPADNFSHSVPAQDHTVAVGTLMDWIEERSGRDAFMLEKAIEDIRHIQNNARNNNDTTRPRWPMIVLRSPKGWTGPKMVDGLQVEGTFRAHQLPLHPRAHPEHLKLLEDWLKSYRPEELFMDTIDRLPQTATRAST